MDPVIFQIGSFRLQYYGLMYLIAFAVTYYLVLYRIRTEKRFDVSRDQVDGLTTAMIIGVIAGGRLGYVVFYNLGYYFSHPWEIVLPFDFSNGLRFVGISGMSYHGGLIGVILATVIFTRRHHIDFREAMDLYGPAVPLGYTFGRIGNFINGELYGRITQSPIGMYFPSASEKALRHPSQLYEAFFEGLFLFGLLWTFRKRVVTKGAMLAFYLMGYGLVRFGIEFFREPDAHIGYGFLGMTRGQWLCGAMTAAGLLIYAGLRLKGRRNRGEPASARS